LAKSTKGWHSYDDEVHQHEMKIPRFLLGAALLFWGWQTGLIVFAVIMAALLESARFIPRRWEFSQTEFNRIWDLCGILFVGALIYAFVANDGADAVSTFFQSRSFAARNRALMRSTNVVLFFLRSLPIVFFPIAVVQAFSVQDQISFTTFSWFLRRRAARETKAKKIELPEGGLNVSHPFFAVCLLAASTTNQRALWFYVGLSLLLAWALWFHRSVRFSPVLWSVLLMVALAGGYGVHLGLSRLQAAIENWNASWLARFVRQGFDANESRTDIGAIGKLKLSGRIVLRLEADGSPPPLLREASYNFFQSPAWQSRRRDVQLVFSETNETTWILLPEKRSQRTINVSRYLRHGMGLLALPNGTSQLDELPVLTMERNRLGAVRVADGPGLVRYVTHYDEGLTFDGPPDEEDLRIPEAEQPALSQITAQLQWTPNGSASEKMRSVSAFFQGNFNYSTYSTASHAATSNQTALAAFLLQSHAGHCEYFATATVLLLRQAGIPARYAVGYSVQEGSGKRFVVRERHAHAWCLAYVDGVWRDFDTTPSSWNEIESRHASFWEPIKDFFSGVWFEISKWRWSRTSFRTYLLWLALALFVGLAARFFLAKQWARARQSQSGKNARLSRPGLDSEFYLIEQELMVQGFERQTGETLAGWISRIEPQLANDAQTLRPIVSLHYKYRFDPMGLTPAERESLRVAAHSWIERTAKTSDLGSEK
jgi:protein-glutamine gamma-glutamyltransferase